MTADPFGLPPREAIRYVAEQANLGTDRWDDIWKGAHTRSFIVAGVQADDMLATIRAARDKAVRDGTTLAEFRRDLKPLLGRLGWEARGKSYVAWRTRLIYETNLRSAYAAGQYEQQTDPEVLALLPVWKYRHSGAKDPRPEHVRWDGLILRHDDAWWNTHYPPNGWGCGCWVEPMTAAAAEAEGGVRQAPEILRRAWRDPVSGRTDMVPIGIDPGWDYNVGAEWRNNRDLPGSSTPIPPDWPPPAPDFASLSSATARPLPAPRAIGSEAVTTFRNATRADRQLSRDYAPWGESLSEEEAAALAQHKAGRTMNLALRGEIDRPDLVAAADRLVTALRRARVPETMAVFRGIGGEELDWWADAEVGQTRRLGAMVPTSVVAEAAQRFAFAGWLTIVLPAGLRGAGYVHPFPRRHHPNYEMLLAPGMLFRVLRREGARLVLEVVDERGGDGG